MGAKIKAPLLKVLDALKAQLPADAASSAAHGDAGAPVGTAPPEVDLPPREEALVALDLGGEAVASPN